MCIRVSSCTQVSDIVPTRFSCLKIGSCIIFTIFDMIFQLLNNQNINISCNCYFHSHFPNFSNLPAAPRPLALSVIWLINVLRGFKCYFKFNLCNVTIHTNLTHFPTCRRSCSRRVLQTLRPKKKWLLINHFSMFHNVLKFIIKMHFLYIETVHGVLTFYVLSFL